MDAALITVIVAVAAAAGFGVVAWRAMDDQRRRSAARVAALASALDVEASGSNSGSPQNRLKDAAPVAVSSMFGTTPGAAVGGRPLIKAAVVGAMTIALVVVVAMANRDHAAPAAASTDGAPLELVSMRHTRDGNTLKVAGLVRNPHAGASVDRIAAVVFAFDRHGTFVTSAQAPLDFIALAPGDESPFVVTLPNVGDVGRYRVSFRTDAGVVRHVDRRAAQVAQTAAGEDRQVSAN